jgi:hypothetical protein
MTSGGIENIVARTGKSAKQALQMLERMSPQNRLITSGEVAALAVLLASEEGRGINGQAINVDGGTVLCFDVCMQFVECFAVLSSVRSVALTLMLTAHCLLRLSSPLTAH